MKNNTHTDAAELRRRAETRLSEKQNGQKSEARDPRISEETVRLVHELQIHQIELEMQNEQLKKAHAEVDALLIQYTDLYDFAPAGYLTLDREGTIRQMNLTGTQMLGVERARLVNRRFGLFMAESDRPMFSEFLEKVFAGEIRETCEVTLLREDTQPSVVQIEGIRSADGQECHAVVLDITERKKMEAELKKKMNDMERFNKLAVGRELAMIELKKEVNALLKKSGQEEKYKIVEGSIG